MEKQTVTSGLEWNSAMGLAQRLREDKRYRDYLLILCGCYFGLRIGDLLTLRWNQVLNKSEVHLTEKKTGKVRTITINPKVKDVIRFCFDHYDSIATDKANHFIFGNRWGSALTISYVNKRLKQIFQEYNIKARKPSSHTLRKTFGKRVWEANGKTDTALIHLSYVFSHSSTQITRRYIGIVDETIADIYMSI